MCLLRRLDMEVRGLEVQVKTLGALLPERRGIAWQVPRLAPGDRAAHSLTIQMLG